MVFLSRAAQGTKDGLRFAGFLLADFLLPTHGKRLLFLVSLYCYINGLDALRQDALNRLNMAMSLAKYGDALKLPAAMSDVIWGQTAVRSVLNAKVLNGEVTPKQTLEVAERVVAMSPRFLRYRSFNAMVSDARELINNSTGLQPMTC